jgi:hypothetical protein
VDTLAGPVRAEWQKVGAAVRGRVIASSNVRVSLRDDARLSQVARNTKPAGTYSEEHVFEFDTY